MKPVPRTVIQAVIALTVVLVIGVGVSTVYRAGPYTFGDVMGQWKWGSNKHRSDFSICIAAARAYLDGTSFYETSNVRGWHYCYAPVFVLLYVPFAKMPVFLAALLWYLLSVAAVAVGVRFCVQMVQQDRPSDQAFWVCAVPPLLLIWPTMSGLARGQITAPLFGLVMGALYYQWRGRESTGGGLLGVAILLKVFPGLLLPYFVWQKRWKFLIVAFLAVVVGVLVLPTIALGWNRNLQYLREWGQMLQRPTFEQDRAEDPRFNELISPDLVRNQSLQAVLKRLTGSAGARWIAGGFGLAMAAVMGWLAWRGRGSNRLLLLAALIVWALLMSPVSWNHYFILLMLPLTALVSIGTGDADPACRRTALIALGVTLALNVCLAWNRACQYFGPLCWGAVTIWAALITAVIRKTKAAV
jgi:hypothetical protein